MIEFEIFNLRFENFCFEEIEKFCPKNGTQQFHAREANNFEGFNPSFWEEEKGALSSYDIGYSRIRPFWGIHKNVQDYGHTEIAWDFKNKQTRFFETFYLLP